MNISGGSEVRIENQFETIKKFGPVRVHSLELLNAVLSLLYPSKNQFAHCMRDFFIMSDDVKGFNEKYANFQGELMDSADYPMAMARFLDTMTKRHLVSALLNVLQNYSYCTIACILCV